MCFLLMEEPMHAPTKDKIQVWDVFVRASHWLLAAGFFVAYSTEEDAMTVHAWAGYLVGALLVLGSCGDLSAHDTRALATSFTRREQS
jgi:cytochrome b